jgi:hypothetical protein
MMLTIGNTTGALARFSAPPMASFRHVERMCEEVVEFDQADR